MSSTTIKLIILAVVCVASLAVGQTGGAPESPPCPRAHKIDTNYHFRNTLHFICLSKIGLGFNLTITPYGSTQPLLEMVIDDSDVKQVASFVDEDGNLRILLANPTRANGTSMYSVDKDTLSVGLGSINSQFVESMRIWRLELNLGWQLALANQPDYKPLVSLGRPTYTKPLPKLTPILTLYAWRPSYFDVYQNIKLPQEGRITKLQPLHLNGHEILIVAMEPYRDTSLPGWTASAKQVDTLIYKLDFGDGNLNWVLHQTLDTKVALDVSSFTVTHQGSLLRDYYIAVIARLPDQALGTFVYDSHAKRNNRLGLVIYKYYGDKFYITNSVEVQNAAKLDAIAYGVGDSYVIIAIVSMWTNQLTLYNFDGLELKQISAPMKRPNLMSPQPPIQLSSYAARPRRTMPDEPADIHLFLAPLMAKSTDEQKPSATVKRTFSQDTSQLQHSQTPFLAVSEPFSEEQLDDGKTPDKTVSLYEIPQIDSSGASGESDENKSTSDNSNTSHIKRDYIGTGENLLNWCKTQLDSLFRDDFNQLGARIQTLPNARQQRPIHLFGDLVIEDSLHVSNMLYAARVVEADRTYKVNSSGLDFSQTYNNIERALKDIDEVNRLVNDILVDDGTPQDVYNSVTFDEIQVTCPNAFSADPIRGLNPYMHPRHCGPTVNQINTVYLNQRNVTDIRRKALLTGRGMNIERDVRFEHLVLRGRTNILGSLNNIPVDDIVFKRGPPAKEIYGHKKLRNGLYMMSNVQLGDWDGVTIGKDTILTSSGSQRVTSNVAFSNVVFDQMRAPWGGYTQNSRIERLNGLHLDSHLAQIAVSNLDNQFNVPLHFEELILNGPINFGQSATLASNNLQDLWDHAMFSYKHQNISAPIEFSGHVELMPGNDINVDGWINGRLLNSSNVLMRDQDFRFANPIVFDDVDANDILVEKSLNGIDVSTSSDSQKPELSILLDEGTQTLMGSKLFNNIILGGKSTIRGPINGQLDLLKLHNMANNHTEPFNLGTVNLAGNIRVANETPMHVSARVNGISTDQLCSFALSALNTNQTRYNRLRFEQPIKFKSLRCGAVNGFNNLTRVFMTRHGYQNIPGTLRLTNGAIFNTTLAIESKFNNMDVAPLSRAVMQTIQESRTGHKEHLGDLFIDELNAGQINDLVLSNVFVARSDNPQVVRARMVFNHLDIENVLNIGSNLVANSFNNLNISDLFFNTLQYDTPQTVYNPIELDMLHTVPNSNLVTNSVNGINLRRFFSDAVLVDVAQQILAPKTFRAPVDLLDRSYLRYGIDGIAENELKTNLLLHSDELIEGDLEFSNDVTIRNELEIVSGMINDMDVDQFVEDMLYESRPNTGMRVVGNGSIRFHDVVLNNLIIAGTIQGVDPSREFVLKGEIDKNAYEAKRREQQSYNTNARLLNSLKVTGSSFNVATKYRGEQFKGVCQVHSCPRTTPMQPPPPPPPSPAPYTRPVQLMPRITTRPTDFRLAPQPFVPGNFTHYVVPQSIPLQNSTPHYNVPFYTTPLAPYVSHGLFNTTAGPSYINVQRPPQAPANTQLLQPVPRPPVSLIYPNVAPQPPNYINVSNSKTVWQPNWALVSRPHQYSNVTYPMGTFGSTAPQPLVDPRYSELVTSNKVAAIRNLMYRINRYIAISFYYEIAQKHPLLGPVLHAPSNPIVDEQGGGPLLLLRTTGKLGQPCSSKNQTIAVTAPQRSPHSMTVFTQNSVIQETSNPRRVDSVVLAAGPSHYLFILDFNTDLSPSGSVSQVLVYRWHYESGRYELEERLIVDGFPTTLRAFKVDEIPCFVLAQQRVVHSNYTGSPLLYCKYSAESEFRPTLMAPMQNVFDLDIVVMPQTGKVVVAALAQQDTEQIGDLIIGTIDLRTRSTSIKITRRLIRPLKLHLFNIIGNSVQLIVSEAITSNDAAQASSRVYTLQVAADNSSDWRALMHENQVIRDNQFYDIQSVLFNNQQTLLFMQSAHSISIYAPKSALIKAREEIGPIYECQSEFSLVQRLPTKGANRFLVYNDNNYYLRSNGSRLYEPYGHYLVLSKDDCAQQQFSTIILKAKFK